MLTTIKLFNRKNHTRLSKKQTRITLLKHSSSVSFLGHPAVELTSYTCCMTSTQAHPPQYFLQVVCTVSCSSSAQFQYLSRYNEILSSFAIPVNQSEVASNLLFTY